MAGLALAGGRGLRNLALTGTAVCMLTGAMALPGSAGMARADVTRPAVTAPGAPGAASLFDLARKDCVGTSRNTGSKVWYTVAAACFPTSTSRPWTIPMSAPCSTW